MAFRGSWINVGVAVGTAACLILLSVWAVHPELFERRSSPVVLTGITRVITYEGFARGNVTGSLTSGCSACPLTILAGTSVTVWIGAWYANLTYGAGRCT